MFSPPSPLQEHIVKYVEHIFVSQEFLCFLLLLILLYMFKNKKWSHVYIHIQQEYLMKYKNMCMKNKNKRRQKLYTFNVMKESYRENREERRLEEEDN